MKKLITLGVISLFIVQAAIADKLTFTFNFNDPVLKKNDKGYTEIKFSDCWNYGREGYPSLPMYGAKILLPQNQEISSIKIIYANYSSLVSGVVINPAVKQVPFSKPDKNYVVVPAADIYTSKKPFPGNIISTGNTQFLSGHSIGLFTICPLIYLPADSAVKFLQEIKIEVETNTTARATEAAKFLRNSDAVQKRISKLVYNPLDISKYRYSEKMILGEYDLLLISNNALLPYFDDYVNFKTSTGFAIKTISVEDIYVQYTGADDQEKIRNCIIDYYQNKGIYYVILGGDADPNSATDKIVPHRGLTIADAYGYSEYDLPSDEYYSCLDGNWNNNGNAYWGEVGEFDLFAEVSIGRICVDNSTEIQNMTNKLYMYQNEPVISDIEKTLMVGEDLGWTMWGSDYMQEIVLGSSNNGYTTVGISPSQTINTLYETTSYSIAPADLYNQYNNVGANLINHLGHANTDYSMKLYNADITGVNFQNNGITRGFPIVYTQGCYSGAFDNRDDAGSYYAEDCFAENITTFATGDVATIENSRYGWGDVDGTDGASQRLHRQFNDAIFGENITQIGDANRDAKDENAIYSDTNSVVRWCAYESTLFGDPTMDIWTAIPTPITVVYPSTVIFGAADITFQTDAPNARIGLMQDGILIGRAITDAGGNAIVTLVSNISSVDTIFVSVIAHNRNRHQGYITVASPTGPYVVRDSYTIDDAAGNNNGLADYGENIALSLTVKNIGIALADSVTIYLSTSDPYITITDTAEFYGDILPDSLAFIVDGYAFTVADSIPDNHSALFSVRATDGDTDWVGSFIITLKAPVLHVGNITILDPLGNNNGRLDPGETVDVIISSNNTGHSDALNSLGTLTSSSPYITVNTPNYNIGTLASMASADAVFSITVSPSTPVASIIDLSFTVAAGDYTAGRTFLKTVGLVEEDWESGDFTNMSWSTSGDVPWIITNVNPYDGIYSAKSGVITDSQQSVLELMYSNVPCNDSVTFYRKVSSEASYDFLQFYIDNSVMGQWSGEQDWARISYPLTAGTHILKWVYIKDGSVSSGSDCAWIDDIILPPQIPVHQDAWMYAMSSPVSAMNLTSTEPVTVTIKNAGDSAISNIPVSYSINGGSAVTEIYNGTLNPNDSYIYTFSAAADLSVIGAYQFKVYTSLAGDTIYTNDTLNVLVNNLPEAYCDPTAVCSYGDMIQEFILNDLDHYDTTGCDLNGYGDHMNRVANLLLGKKYQLQASVGYANENLSLWIDFNDDFTFDTTEILLADMNIATAYVLTGDSIQIPAGANTGSHRMRVRIHWVNTSADPCVAFDYGETHDYMVNIIDGSGINEQTADNQVVIFPNPSEGIVNILYSSMNENTRTRLYNIQGQLIFEDKNWPSSGIKQIDLSGQSEGVYYLEVSDDNMINSYKIVKY